MIKKKKSFWWFNLLLSKQIFLLQSLPLFEFVICIWKLSRNNKTFSDCTTYNLQKSHKTYSALSYSSKAILSSICKKEIVFIYILVIQILNTSSHSVSTAVTVLSTYFYWSPFSGKKERKQTNKQTNKQKIRDKTCPIETGHQ